MFIQGSEFSHEENSLRFFSGTFNPKTASNGAPTAPPPLPIGEAKKDPAIRWDKMLPKSHSSKRAHTVQFNIRNAKSRERGLFYKV